MRLALQAAASDFFDAFAVELRERRPTKFCLWLSRISARIALALTVPFSVDPRHPLFGGRVVPLDDYRDIG